MCMANLGVGLKDSADPLGVAHTTRAGSSPLERASDPLGLKDGMNQKPAQQQQAAKIDPRIDSSPDTLSSQLEKKRNNKTVLGSAADTETLSSNVLSTATRQ